MMCRRKHIAAACDEEQWSRIAIIEPLDDGSHPESTAADTRVKEIDPLSHAMSAMHSRHTENR